MPHSGGLGEEDCGWGGDLISSGEKRKSESERFNSEDSSVKFRFGSIVSIFIHLSICKVTFSKASEGCEACILLLI
jgi:hypothetical protein